MHVNSGHRLRLVLMATSALAALSAAPAFAQSHAFNIPGQPAQDGIANFAEQANVQILVSEDAAHGRKINAVKGDYDTSTGLRLLLADTGLQAKPAGAGTYSVVAAAQTPESDKSATSPETVIVTGRAGAEAQRRAETSYSISVIPQERIRETGASSVADTVRNIPGFWVENSGGEASANIRARGIPVDGYSSVQVEEDGMPIQHDPGLGYLNVDQSFRFDETISEIQVVRGGPSSVFAPNAPGGVINYITRKPTDDFQGLAKFTVGDDGLYRADLWVGGPVGGGWRAMAGGFFRVEQGVRNPGYNFNDGGQFRVYAEHDIGSDGLITFDYKHIDDKVGFYLPIPVAADGSGGVTSVPGFNASTGILNGPETERLRLLTVNGPKDFDLTPGTDVQLDQFSANFQRTFSGGWHLEDHYRMRSTSQNRLGLFTGSVQTGAVRETQLLPTVQSFFPTTASLQLRYVDNGQPFTSTANGNGLEVDNNDREVSVSERELMNDLRVSNTFDWWGKHDVSVGGYVMSAHEVFTRYSAVLMMDTRNQARLLNLVALDAGGNVIGNVTDNGVLRYGSEFADGQGDQLTTAAYAADEWQITDDLRLDLGVRYEQMHTEGAAEGSKTINLGQTSTLADKNYLTGNGIFTPYDRTFNDLNWTIGLNYQLDVDQGVFARWTKAERMPSISDFITNATNTPVINRTDMYEMGYKLSRPLGDFYATAFDTVYHNYGVSEDVYNNTTATYVLQNYFADTRDYGLELDGVVRPTDWFDIQATGTIQQPTFTSLKFPLLVGGVLTTIDYNGNQLLRIPKLSFAVSPTLHLMDDQLQLQMTVEHYSNRYADAANTQLLPAYTVLNFSARYNISDDLTLYLSGYNLTDSIGLTEGNPRAGEVLSTQAGAPVYLARPIVGRNFRAELLYKF
ncbi:MAG TPA: TonB-dependent receptor [Rhizomicrobium sp.]|nr:TonB-dependent receptor [Rhizomicrobium sp.]